MTRHRTLTIWIAVLGLAFVACTDSSTSSLALGPVPAGSHEFDALGTPITLALDDGWRLDVQNAGAIVLSDESAGPEDRTLTLIRPTHLSSPTADGSDSWPTDRVDDWVAAAGVASEVVLVGGVEALAFDLRPSGSCDAVVGCPHLASNEPDGSRVELIDDAVYRVWWVPDVGGRPLVAVSKSLTDDPGWADEVERVVVGMAFEEATASPVPTPPPDPSGGLVTGAALAGGSYALADGTSFTIEGIDAGRHWIVRDAMDDWVILSHPDSTGPGDRDVVIASGMGGSVRSAAWPVGGSHDWVVSPPRSMGGGATEIEQFYMWDDKAPACTAPLRRPCPGRSVYWVTGTDGREATVSASLPERSDDWSDVVAAIVESVRFDA